MLAGNSILQFTEIKAKGSSGSASLKANYKNTFGLQLDLKFIKKNSWGFNIAGLYLQNAEEKDFEITNTSGVTSYSTSTDSKMQVSALDANAIYNWDVFYIPFELNYTAYNYTTKISAGDFFTTNNGIGIQFGVGFNIANQFAIESQIRSSSISIDAKSSGTLLEYRGGAYGNLTLIGKYYF